MTQSFIEVTVETITLVRTDMVNLESPSYKEGGTPSLGVLMTQLSRQSKVSNLDKNLLTRMSLFPESDSGDSAVLIHGFHVP